MDLLILGLSQGRKTKFGEELISPFFVDVIYSWLYISLHEY